MRVFIIGLALCTIISACSKPISHFRALGTDRTAPSTIDFENLSKGADAYMWLIDSQPVSDSSTLSHMFLSSGRHTIELISKSGSKESISKQDIFIEAPEQCLVYMMTNYGPLLLSLSDITPGHRDNFSDLVESGFYNGIQFHRVINGFMIQAGDETTNPPSQKIRHKAEIKAEINTDLFHYKGALAAARQPDSVNPEKASSGTQFYIVEGQTISQKSMDQFANSKAFDYTKAEMQRYIDEGGSPQLDGEYTVFGHLVEGYDTLDKISNVDTDRRDKPTDPVIIIKATSIN